LIATLFGAGESTTEIKRPRAKMRKIFGRSTVQLARSEKPHRGRVPVVTIGANGRGAIRASLYCSEHFPPRIRFAMAYFAQCDCGRRIPVAASDAGCSKLCPCGRNVTVPALSKLRTAAGQEAHPLNTLETIAKAIAERNPPIGDVCLVSGRPTSERLWIHIACERRWVRNNHGKNAFLRVLGLLSGLAGLMMFFKLHGADESQEFGRDTSIDVPLPIAAEHHAAVSRYGDGKLKSLLRQVPMYARLLDEYPAARTFPA
jgi:hypothetical protein